MPSDLRQYASHTERNRQPILDILRGVLPPTGTVLEIASGSGEHVVFFASQLPALRFQPSDPNPAAVTSVDAWAQATGTPNLLPCLQLDVTASEWPVPALDAVLCINMIHIAPWQAAMGLFQGAARHLASGQPLYLYGPYRRAGVPTAPSNEAFDASLRERNPAWALRDLEAVTGLAEASGFSAPDVTEMPANNLSLVFRRR
jgi:hypothetical protein